MYSPPESRSTSAKRARKRVPPQRLGQISSIPSGYGLRAAGFGHFLVVDPMGRPHDLASQIAEIALVVDHDVRLGSRLGNSIGDVVELGKVRLQLRARVSLPDSPVYRLPRGHKPDDAQIPPWYSRSEGLQPARTHDASSQNQVVDACSREVAGNRSQVLGEQGVDSDTGWCGPAE